MNCTMVEKFENQTDIFLQLSLYYMYKVLFNSSKNQEDKNPNLIVRVDNEIQ